MTTYNRSLSAYTAADVRVVGEGNRMMNRRLTRLILFIFCCGVLTACGGVTKDERVYGTWTEISTGETVEFRRDGTLAWVGMEGTFEFRRSTNWASWNGWLPHGAGGD